MLLNLRTAPMFAAMLLGVSVNANADSWSCSHDDLVREVTVVYPQGGSLPCDVVYRKQTEGVEDQAPWSAENEEGYCEEKARELVARLESWGWVCLETVSTETAAESEPASAEETAAESDPASADQTAADSDPAAESGAETGSD